MIGKYPNQDPSEVTTLESSDRQNRGISIALIAVGGFFLYLLRNRAPLDSNELAAQYLGYFLVFIGGSALLINEKIKVVLKKETRLIQFSSQSLLGKEQKLIPFDGVNRVTISRVGRVSGGVQFYFLHLELKDKKRLPTGISIPNGERALSEARRIAEIIGCECQEIRVPGDHRFANFLIALGIGVFAYIAYYRLTVGPPCAAMWFGNAPPIIIIFVTWFAYSLLRLTRFSLKN